MRHAPFTFVTLLLVSMAACLLLPANSAGERAATSFLGFDLNDYPGDDALGVLRKTFAFTGYWLNPPPEEKRTSWLGKRTLLQSRGFGFAVLYNGRLTRNLKSSSDARQKGASDAEDAARLARQEDFASGSVIFLDIEEGGRLSPAYHDYVKAFIDRLAQSNFRAGAYCSAMPVVDSPGQTITTVHDLEDHLAGRKLFFWAFNDACPPSPGCVFPEIAPAVEQGGSPHAVLWQFAQSPRRKQFTARCAATYNRDGNCYAPGDTAHKWFMDLNVATTNDPSAPR